MDFSGSFNGFSWGAAQLAHLVKVQGLEDLPQLRGVYNPRSGDHGAFAGRSLLPERIVTLQWEVLASSAAALDVALAGIGAALVPQDVDLPLKFNGSTRRLNCRPMRSDVPRQPPNLESVVTAMFRAVDPRLYDETLSTLALGLPTTSTALGPFPIGPFPIGFGTGTGGTGLALNAGNFPTRPIITIAGPCDNPKVENVTAGKALKCSISLSASDVLTIDTDVRSILLNGSAGRRSSLTGDSRWWELAAGTSNLKFTADAYQAAALATISWRSAWIGPTS